MMLLVIVKGARAHTFPAQQPKDTLVFLARHPCMRWRAQHDRMARPMALLTACLDTNTLCCFVCAYFVVSENVQYTLVELQPVAILNCVYERVSHEAAFPGHLIARKQTMMVQMTGVVFDAEPHGLLTTHHI